MYYPAIAVALGGAIGATCRYGVGLLSTVLGLPWPAGTYLVNLIGAILMGAAFAYAEAKQMGELWRGCVMTGILGGFTTVSAWSLEVAQMLQFGQPMRALLYALFTTVCCVSGVFFGMWLYKVV